MRPDMQKEEFQLKRIVGKHIRCPMACSVRVQYDSYLEPMQIPVVPIKIPPTQKKVIADI